ncbi:hypothetical protein [Streptomyces sp. NPDC001828]|uniref:hypothetical protein n=1 Tax=Streptomyces sp. NPDC001828 TaxID=3364615 RepID=UPI00369C7565
MAAYNGRLYAAFKNRTNYTLQFMVYEGYGWNTLQADIPNVESWDTPALAAFQGKLHLVHRGKGSDTQLWHLTYDGTRWSPVTKLPAHRSEIQPALAVYNNRLHLVHRGAGNDVSLWHASYDGTTWSQDRKFAAHTTVAPPALAVLGGELYCIHRGNKNDTKLWWTKLREGSAWTADSWLPDHHCDSGPGAAVYRDKNGTRDQLVVVHRGWGTRAADTDNTEQAPAQEPNL